MDYSQIVMFDGGGDMEREEYDKIKEDIMSESKRKLEALSFLFPQFSDQTIKPIKKKRKKRKKIPRNKKRVKNLRKKIFDIFRRGTRLDHSTKDIYLFLKNKFPEIQINQQTVSAYLIQMAKDKKIICTKHGEKGFGKCNYYTSAKPDKTLSDFENKIN